MRDDIGFGFRRRRSGDDRVGSGFQIGDHLIADASMGQIDDVVGAQMVNGVRIADDGDDRIGVESDLGQRFNVGNIQRLGGLDALGGVGKIAV